MWYEVAKMKKSARLLMLSMMVFCLTACGDTAADRASSVARESRETPGQTAVAEQIPDQGENGEQKVAEIYPAGQSETDSLDNWYRPVGRSGPGGSNSYDHNTAYNNTGSNGNTANSSTANKSGSNINNSGMQYDYDPANSATSNNTIYIYPSGNRENTSTIVVSGRAGADYQGTWVCGKATLYIFAEGDHFSCAISWPESNAEVSQWSYTCFYDNGSLVDNGRGIKSTVTYGTDGLIASTVFRFSDGVGKFTMNENGKLVWTDAKEDAGKNMEFERVRAEQTNGRVTQASAFEGIWVCGRSTIEIEPRGNQYRCTVTWPDSAAKVFEWSYNTVYDNGALIDNGNGTKTAVTYADNGSVKESSVEYRDGSVKFTINANDKLLWSDAKEDAGKDMEYERTSKKAGNELTPQAKQLADGYFRVIGGYDPGTGGVSVDTAKAAYETYYFAYKNSFQSTDLDSLRQSALMAWKSLTVTEQSAFNRNFTEVSDLVNKCLEDWDHNNSLFRDAQVADNMGTLIKDPQAMKSWEQLSAAVSTMKNTSN